MKSVTLFIGLLCIAVAGALFISGGGVTKVDYQQMRSSGHIIPIGAVNVPTNKPLYFAGLLFMGVGIILTFYGWPRR
jgi:hypothetical protein